MAGMLFKERLTEITTEAPLILLNMYHMITSAQVMTVILMNLFEIQVGANLIINGPLLKRLY